MSCTNPWPHRSRKQKSWTWGMLYSLPNHFTPFLNMKSPSWWFFQSPSFLLRLDSTIGERVEKRMDHASPPFPTALLFFFSFFFLYLIPLLLHLLSFSSRMQTSQLKWVTAGCFCWIDIRYHTIHQAADSSPMPSLEEESIPMCTTHMHTHTTTISQS